LEKPGREKPKLGRNFTHFGIRRVYWKEGFPLKGLGKASFGKAKKFLRKGKVGKVKEGVFPNSQNLSWEIFGSKELGTGSWRNWEKAKRRQTQFFPSYNFPNLFLRNFTIPSF